MTRTRTPCATETATATATLPAAFFRVSKNELRGEGATVEISWRLGEPGRTRITLFNSAGEFVSTIYDEANSAYQVYTIVWDGTNEKGEPVSSNVYILRVQGPQFAQNHKIGVQR